MAILLQTIILLANETAIQSPSSTQANSYNNYLQSLGVEMNEERCYGSYGCYNLKMPWTSDQRPVSVFPEDLDKVQPRYPFYSRDYLLDPIYLDINEPYVAEAVGMDPNLPLYVVSHGFTEHGDKDWIKKIKDELLLREDCNVIVVDWGRASSPPYPQAVANIRLAGTVTAHLIENISVKKKGVLDHVHCIGHSLGAHLCGYVGYTLKRNFDLTLGRITGMDPAEPHFGKNPPPVRLDRSAAVYVDVIHTDASGFTSGGFGIIERVGHVDFYPNGGSRQPGCTQTVFEYISSENSFMEGVKKYIGCNHVRSYEFFTESINTKVPSIGITCSSYEDFLAGKCFSCKRPGTYCIPFGFQSYKTYKSLINKRLLSPKRSLVLYLLTGDNTPFCKAHYKITAEISNTEESKMHRGEVGTLWITVHTTTDGAGPKSNRMPLKQGGYHGPGSIYMYIVPGERVDKMKSIEVEFEYQTNVVNPLTWRILSAPRLFVSKVKVDSLELDRTLTVCPKDNKPLRNSIPQIMLPSYCT